MWRGRSRVSTLVVLLVFVNINGVRLVCMNLIIGNEKIWLLAFSLNPVNSNVDENQSNTSFLQ